jgi:hypothetical protein
MKTAMQELIEYIELNIDDNDFIKHEVLEQADNLLEKEKEQMIDFGKKMQLVQHVSYDDDITYCFEPEDYYKKTYNQNK